MEKDFIGYIKSGQLGLMLKEMENRVGTSENAEIKSRYESLCEQYRYMLKFFYDGMNDPHRDEMLKGMLSRAYILDSDLQLVEKFHSSPSYSALMKTLSQGRMDNMSMISSLRDATVSPRDHYSLLNNVFLNIFFSLSWKEQESRMWTAFLIDDSVSSVDSQTIVSAITLSCANGFCIEKFKTLVYVYLTSNDSHVRQRALIGCIFTFAKVEAMPYSSDFMAVIQDLFAEEGTESAVLEILMQIIHCNETERDNKKFNEEIMPEIMKSGAIQITPQGIKENTPDEMDEILNPGKYEEQMEKLESSIDKVRKMQSSGADVFFSGFSMMKRYPFFYKISNWFVPFTVEHPDLAALNYGDNKEKMMDGMLNNPSLCDSDKYSFVFAFQSVMPSLPENVRQAMMEGGGLICNPDGLDEVSAMQSESYIRRMYLQNLYRFFKLNPQIKMLNLFESREWLANLMKANCMSEESLVEMCKFLLRRKYKEEACAFATKIENNSVESGLLLAAIAMEKGEKDVACALYNEILEKSAECRQALNGLAKLSFQDGNYEVSHSAFKRLVALYPDNLSYQINNAMSGVLAGKGEELLNEVYRLDFENDNNGTVKRLLAWTLLCLGRFAQAKSIYEKILRNTYDDATENDIVCMMDLYWLEGDTKSCIDMIRKYCDSYLKGKSDEETCDCLRKTLSSEATNLKPYFPDFLKDTSLLIDSVIFLQSPSSSCG